MESIERKGSLKAIIRARTVLNDPFNCRPGVRDHLGHINRQASRVASAPSFCERAISENLVWLIAVLRDGTLLNTGSFRHPQLSAHFSRNWPYTERRKKVASVHISSMAAVASTLCGIELFGLPLTLSYDSELAVESKHHPIRAGQQEGARRGGALIQMALLVLLRSIASFTQVPSPFPW